MKRITYNEATYAKKLFIKNRDKIMKGGHGKIFLSGERGCTQTEWFRSYNTFNFDAYQNEHKHAFAGLYLLNDDTLAGGNSLQMSIEEYTHVLLLPVVGNIAFETLHAHSGSVNPGEVQLLTLNIDDVLKVLNPYKDELINFLQLWFKPMPDAKLVDQLFRFNLEEEKNKIIQIVKPSDFHSGNNSSCPIISIGKFAGRGEAFYKMSKPQNNLFLFAIEGAFEVHGRLLHPRDGLALWNEQGDIEIEALSNDAIIFIIELPAYPNT